MDYFSLYDRLIDRARTRVMEGYNEKHHVIPRCMGGTDDPSNLVKLTPEEHYIAHQILVKMYPNNSKLVNAALYMCSRPSNKTYGWLKRKQAEQMRKYNPNAGGHARREYVKKHGHPAKSYNLSEEGRKKISSQMKANNPVHKLEVHPNQTKVAKIDPETKEVVALYDSMKEAHNAEKLTSTIFSKIDSGKVWRGHIWERVGKDISGRWQRKN